MFTKIRPIMIGPTLAILLFCCNAAPAQNERKYTENAAATTKAAAKLQGAVEKHALRIDRANPNAGQFAGQSNPQTGSTFLMDAAEFAGNPRPMPEPRPLSGSVDRLSGGAAVTAKPKGKYVWNLSRDGGYYDATGQISVVVPGDQLYKYGGTFVDGTPVPDSPVVTNFANHAYRFPYVLKRGQQR